MTPLDRAFAAQEGAPDDAAVRLRFHERVLDAELFVPLAEAPGPDRLRPQVFVLDEGAYVLAFDREDRLAGFLAAPAEFAALSGRRLAGLLEGQGVGVALNLGAASGTLLPPGAVDWLAGMAADAPAELTARPEAVARPGTVPPALLAALGPKLAAMAGPVGQACLVEARYRDAGSGLLLALAGVPEAVRPGVAAAVAEAVRFSAADVRLDVAFLGSESPEWARLAAVGLGLDIPLPAGTCSGLGMDPGRPPWLLRRDHITPGRGARSRA
jgi:hypothetical protein